MSMDTDPPMPQKRALKVHRCKAVNYTPAGIVSLAATPNYATSRRWALACARSNGDIELWNPKGQGWFLERTIPGSPNSPIETVLWIRQTDLDPETKETDFDTPEERKAYIQSLRKSPPRLITAGLDGRVIEWDTISLRPHQIAEVGGGAVWCAAVNRTHTRLAIGCEDGHVRILDVADGRLEMIKLLEKTPTRVLSIAWHKDRNIVVVGGADSSIRKMDTKTGRTIQRMTTETVHGEETIVWALKVLPDSTILSGDSMGKVTFWDWKSGTPVRTLRPHQADVLCLAHNKAGDKVWSSGVDRKVVQFTHFEIGTTTSSNPSKNKRKNFRQHTGGKEWIVTGEKRYHSHDVRALCLLEKPYDALVSGGVDTELVISSPITEFPLVKHYRMPTFPHRSIIQITRSTRLMLGRFQDHVKVWQLGRALSQSEPPSQLRHFEKLDHQRETLLLNIKPKCGTNLCASGISEDGRWIAVSDGEGVKVFEVDIGDGRSSAPKVKKSKTFPSPSLIPAASTLTFTPDSKRLIIAGTDSVLYIVDLSQGSFEIVKKFGVHRGEENEIEQEDRMDVDGDEESGAGSSGKVIRRGGREMIATLAVSADGQWLASGDLLNRIHVFNLDSLKHHATLPIFTSLHTSLAFHPTSPPTLTIPTISNEFYLYDCEESRLTDWSREYSHRLPHRWLNREEVVMGAAFAPDPVRPNVLVLHGAGHVTFVDLERDVGDRDAYISASSKRKFMYTQGTNRKWRQKGLLESQYEEFKKWKAAVGEAGVVNGIDKDHDDEEEGKEGHVNGHMVEENGVILIDSGTDDEGGGDLNDADDTIPPTNGTTTHLPNGISNPKTGTKRPLSTTKNSESPIFSESFHMEHRYGPVMGLGFLEGDEMVVVERPVLSVIHSLGAPAFAKKKYGT